jgi:hypothetical protein
MKKKKWKNVLCEINKLDTVEGEISKLQKKQQNLYKNKTWREKNIDTRVSINEMWGNTKQPNKDNRHLGLFRDCTVGLTFENQAI